MVVNASPPSAAAVSSAFATSASLMTSSASSAAASASLLGFAASGATMAVAGVAATLSSDSSSTSTAPTELFASLLDALLPTAHCLELVDPNNGKTYDVETKTYGSLFTPWALLVRAALNGGLVYAPAVHRFIEVRRGGAALALNCCTLYTPHRTHTVYSSPVLPLRGIFVRLHGNTPSNPQALPCVRVSVRVRACVCACVCVCENPT
jgi:hypothetical protein